MEISLNVLIVLYILIILIIPALGVILFYHEAIKHFSDDWISLFEENKKKKKQNG